MKTRREQDGLGALDVPADAYWGIHTERARANFPFPGPRAAAELVQALATVKRACLAANRELGYVPDDLAAPLDQACAEVAAGQWAEQFPLSALQGGAGTSLNMNLNEALANRALELLGEARGRYDRVDPLRHVNLHQSTNDVYPTAVAVALIRGFRALHPAFAAWQGALQERERTFAEVVKLGRTELQEAAPLTLGVEFGAWAEAVARDRWRTFKCEERLRTVPLGGTAVGTGLTAPRDYIFLAIEKLRELTGMGLTRPDLGPDAVANGDRLVECAGMLEAAASNLIKIAQDWRLLNLLGELRLPPLQAGSSIMPGKVNPVLAEAAIAVGLRVAANSRLVGDAVSRGTLQLCEFLPPAAEAMLESQRLLLALLPELARHTAALRADEAACRARLARSPALITALLPRLGYARAEELLRRYHALPAAPEFQPWLEQELDPATVRDALTPQHLTALGHHQPITSNQ